MSNTAERTLEVYRDGRMVREYFGRGIRPLVDALVAEPEVFEGADVYDRIVGRAAAAFYVRFGVVSVTAKAMSIGAAKLLRAHGIAVAAEDFPESIVNRDGTGICPMERAVEGLDEINAMIVAVKAKLQTLP